MDENEKAAHPGQDPAPLHYLNIDCDKEDQNQMQTQAQWIVITTPFNSTPYHNHLSNLTDQM